MNQISVWQALRRFWQSLQAIRLLDGVVVVGLLMALIPGLFSAYFLWHTAQFQPTVKCPTLPLGELSQQPDSALEPIWVDINGAVVKPGSYQLPAGSRLQVLLDLAGGVTASAQASYVARDLNLAQSLVDQQKIYIPFEGEAQSTGVEQTTESGLVSLNSATQQELENLPGIGSKRASDIIANRPYQELSAVLQKNVITETVWEDIKDLISL